MTEPVAGPFFFALTDETETVFGYEHERMDFYIFDFKITGSEDDFDHLSIEIKHPGLAFIAPGQPRWCWFAFDNGTEVIPRFRGKLVAIPSNLQDLTITLEFVATPVDFDDQKKAISDALKAVGRPWWDIVFVDERQTDDPDAIRETMALNWFTHPVTLEVGYSDIIFGEDGTVEFDEGTAFLDGFDVRITEPPVAAIDVEAKVAWKQSYIGSISFGPYQWRSRGFESVINAWPRTGDQLAGGWSVLGAVAEGFISKPRTVSFNVSYQNNKKTHRNGDLMSLNESYSGPPGPIPVHGAIGGRITVGLGGIVTKYTETLGDESKGTPFSVELECAGAFVEEPSGGGSTGMVLGYGANRDRSEVLAFTMRSEVQEIFKSSGDNEIRDKLTPDGNDVDSGDNPALTNSQSPSYFMTPRGAWSVDYCVMLGAARLKAGGRVVEITWGCAFERVLDLTLRMNATIRDFRLNGGLATGKIIAYTMNGNGDSGVFDGSVTIGCCVGTGSVIVESEGDGVYAAPGYMAPGYQQMEGKVTTVVGSGGDVSHTDPILVPNDDGLVFPLTKSQVTIREEQHQGQFVPPDPTEAPRVIDITPSSESGFGSLSQKRLQELQDLAQKQAADLNNYRSWLELELISLDKGTFGSKVTIEATLVLPKGYDAGLAAPLP